MDSLRKEVKEGESTRVVVGVIVNGQGEILVGRRVVDDKWELPGGRTKAQGTRLEDELVERVNEEVGPIGIHPRHLLWRERQSGKEAVSDVFFIKCDLPFHKRPMGNLELHRQLVWKQGNELAGLDFIERDKRFIQSYEQWRKRV